MANPIPHGRFGIMQKVLDGEWEETMIFVGYRQRRSAQAEVDRLKERCPAYGWRVSDKRSL